MSHQAAVAANPFEGFEVISSYSRAQSIDDGNLIDVSPVAREAGITFPVALTLSVWNAYVAVPPGVVGQDEAGRMWDIVWMLRHAIKTGESDGDLIFFELYVRNDNRRPAKVKLKAMCGPGDECEPVITVMFPEES